jgi:hypothetical protein
VAPAGRSCEVEDRRIDPTGRGLQVRHGPHVWLHLPAQHYGLQVGLGKAGVPQEGLAVSVAELGPRLQLAQRRNVEWLDVYVPQVGLRRRLFDLGTMLSPLENIGQGLQAGVIRPAPDLAADLGRPCLRVGLHNPPPIFALGYAGGGAL